MYQFHDDQHLSINYPNSIVEDRLRCARPPFVSTRYGEPPPSGRLWRVSYHSGFGSAQKASCCAREGARHTPPPMLGEGSTPYQNQRPSSSWAAQDQPAGQSAQSSSLCDGTEMLDQ